MSALKLSSRIVGIAGLFSVVVLAYGFSSATTGITFAMGNGFNLKIDSNATWNGVLQAQSTWALKNLNPGVDKFFNISDVKPGDRGEATISLHVNKDAWICLDFEKLKEKENGRNEPEKEVDSSGGSSQGELADGTEFFGWFDDGDNIFEIGETPIFGTSSDEQAATKSLDQITYALADSKTGNPLVASTTRYIGITWCAGNLEVNLLTAVIGCDGTVLGNEAQTDSFSVDISFRAATSKDNKKFLCTKKGTTCKYSCDGDCKNGSVNINIVNTGTINSTTTSNSNTGGNSAGGGGSVITGNASSSASSTNILNRTEIRVR